MQCNGECSRCASVARAPNNSAEQGVSQLQRRTHNHCVAGRITPCRREHSGTVTDTRSTTTTSTRFPEGLARVSGLSTTKQYTVR